MRWPVETPQLKLGQPMRPKSSFEQQLPNVSGGTLDYRAIAIGKRNFDLYRASVSAKSFGGELPGAKIL